ncbi:DUF2256 domain-containing protein [Thauera humireducens]|uniref:DUF2256 domain-containing protein n=1 Tax=Thauera humireducens TaxID=1134435 RepID=UPI00311EBD73
MAVRTLAHATGPAGALRRARRRGHPGAAGRTRVRHPRGQVPPACAARPARGACGQSRDRRASRFAQATGGAPQAVRLRRATAIRVLRSHRACARNPTCPPSAAPAAGRPFASRKRWEKDWDAVRYYSERCRRERRTAAHAEEVG